MTESRLSFWKGKEKDLQDEQPVVPWLLAQMTRSSHKVRFSDLVENLGKPEIVTFWGDPANDRAFSRAATQNRVLTVHQTNVGSRRDFGVIGYHPEPRATYVVFPKPLPQKTDVRVVGIKYDLIDQPAPKGPVVQSKSALPRALISRPATRTRERTEAKRAKRSDLRTRRRFEVTIRCTATMEIQKAIEAATQREAKSKVLQEIRQSDLDLSDAQISKHVIGIRKIET